MALSLTGRGTFVGRESELTRLTERLGSAGRGEGGVVFIGGEPGIGKSRLLLEFAGRARAAGWLVLEGRAYSTEGMPAYLPFVEALSEHVPACADEDLRALLEDAPALATLIPDIRRRLPGVPVRDPLGPEAERFRLFEGVSNFFLQAARSSGTQGLLLCLDDLQWADRTALLLLVHLARKLKQSHLLVVGAYRTGDADQAPALPEILEDMAREHMDERITLPRLSLDETRAVIDGLCGMPPAPAVLRAVHAQTDGNPLFVEEVVRQLISEKRDLSREEAARDWGLPAGVRANIERRVSRLSMDARGLLQGAAVLGERIVPEFVKAMSGLPDEAAVNCMEEAGAAGMLREEGMTYVFAHPLIRQGVYEGLSLARRQQLHGRAAALLESRGPGVGGYGDDGTIGHHWRLAGQPDRAIDYLLRAGDTAIGLTSWEEAARYWEAAGECMEQSAQPPARRARLLEGLGDLYFLSTFQAHPAVERYEAASALYEQAGDPFGWARAQSLAGRSLAYPTSGFDYPGALRHLRAAEPVLASGPPSVELGELYAALAHAESHALQNGPDRMIEAMRLVGEIAEKLEDDFLSDFLRVQSYHLQGHYLGLQGRLAEGLALEEFAAASATDLKGIPGPVNQWPGRWRELLLIRSGDDQGPMSNDIGSVQLSLVTSRVGLANFTTNCCGWQSLDLNDPLRARAKHEQIRDVQGRFITPFLLYDLALCGDIDALRALAEGGTTALSTINPDTVSSAHTMMAFAEGRWEDFESSFRDRGRKWRDGGSNSITVLLDRMLLRACRVTGEVEASESLLEESLRISLGSGAVKYEMISRIDLALLLGETGRLDEEETHLARCREILADGEDWRGIGGRLALAEAVHAAARGRHEEADAHFDRSIESFRGLSLPWDETEGFEVWARSCRRFYRGRGRRAFVLQKLGAARNVYERIGVGQPWLDRLNALEMQLLGAAANVIEDELPDNLTGREVEVLRLIALGKSNKEIGDGLVLSVRTVERHIANIYLKTGAHGRVEAATYAHAHDISAHST